MLGVWDERHYQDENGDTASPAIITRLLHTSIFLNLKDLGVELPHYTEEVLELGIDGEHGRQYRGMESILRHMVRRDPRYLSLRLQQALPRPNSALRGEIVVATHASVPVSVASVFRSALLSPGSPTRSLPQNQRQI